MTGHMRLSKSLIFASSILTTSNNYCQQLYTSYLLSDTQSRSHSAIVNSTSTSLVLSEGTFFDPITYAHTYVHPHKLLKHFNGFSC